MLQERLELTFLLHLRKIRASTYRSTIHNGIWHSRPASDFAKNFLDLTIASLSTLIQFDESVVDSSRINGIFPIRRIRSVCFGKNQKATFV